MHQRFNHVQNLEINDSISLEFFSNIVDLNQVKCLRLFSLNNIRTIIFLLQAMPHVHRLEINRATDLNLFEISRRIRFEKIRTFIIYNYNFDDINIEGWCYLFPNVIHLT